LGAGVTEIRLERLTKHFGSVEAIRGIDLVIEDGKFTVFVGPSGCGKTTTLRMIAGLEEISEGSIRFDGEAVEHLAPKERDIAMVFQSYALGIETLLDRKPRQLSGGQRQRVAMGRALVREPRAFLFDEPLSNLDAALRAQMRVELKRIHQRLKTTIVYVTHDQIEAMTLADKIVIMRNGLIEQVGDPLTLYKFPASKFVAGFIGSPKMNFIPARLDVENGELKAKLGDGAVLTLPRSRLAAYSAFAGKEVEIGLRPEHLTDRPVALDDDCQFIEGVIDVIEPMGSTSLMTFLHGGAVYFALGDADRVRRPGELIRLCAQLREMHLIDPISEQVVPTLDNESVVQNLRPRRAV
jgi:multiple sugar transport system ATP-binding protein